MKNQSISIHHFQGVKNSDTGKVERGYLYVNFKERLSGINNHPCCIGAKPSIYEAGSRYGFNVPASTRKEAIEYFNTHFDFTPVAA